MALDHTKLLTFDKERPTKATYYVLFNLPLPVTCEQTKWGLFRQGTLYSQETVPTITPGVLGAKDLL